MNPDRAQIAAHGTAQRLDAIDKLIAAVEAGGDWPPLDDLWKSMGLGDGHRVGLAYNGSLDAALALHNALLPGWVAKLSAGGAGAGVTKWHCTVEDWNEGTELHGDNQPSTARAWLLAILKAYRAQIAQETA